MKHTYIFCLLFISFFSSAQIVNIPNANFKAKLLAASPSNTTAKDLAGNYFKIDANSDGQIQTAEALEVSYISIFNSNVANIQGISSFSNLTFFVCSWNPLPNIDLSGMQNLQTLWAWKCYATSFNFNGCTNLNYIDCGQNSIASLNVSNLTNLATLKCIDSYNSPNTLNINLSGCINLTTLEVNSSRVTNLNLTGVTNLQELMCGGNLLTSLNVSNLTNLIKLDCRVNQITSLDVTNLTNLQELIFYNNNVTSINVSNLTNLTDLWCDNNQLTYLDVSNCTKKCYLVLVIN